MPQFLVVPPTAGPVTVDEVKRALRIDHGEDDAAIADLIEASRQWLDGADGWLGRALLPQTWEVRRCGFPPGPIDLPLAPLRSLGSISYVGSDGVSATLPVEDVQVIGAGGKLPGKILPKAAWPSAANSEDSVRVRYVCGYDPDGTPQDSLLAGPVPMPIRQAIILHVKLAYDALSPADAQVVGARIESLLNPLRLY